MVKIKVDSSKFEESINKTKQLNEELAKTRSEIVVMNKEFNEFRKSVLMLWAISLCKETEEQVNKVDQVVKCLDGEKFYNAGVRLFDGYASGFVLDKLGTISLQSKRARKCYLLLGISMVILVILISMFS